MDNEVLMEIKPKFNRWLIETIAWIFAILFVTLIIYAPLYLVGLMALRGYFFTLGILGLILVKLWAFLIRKNYEATTYKTYRDRIEFEEGFINHKYTVIKMADIKEIHLTQSFLQRKVQLGSIRFVTAANSYEASTGVCFMDIENSNDIYAKIKQLHENCGMSQNN